MNDNAGMAICVTVAALAVTAVAFLIGITTHQTKLAQVDTQHDTLIACIQSGRTAADCRLIAYGSK